MNNQEYTITPLNTLAFSKGSAPVCELTGLPAQVQLTCDSLELFYATREHAEQSWHGIMHKISPLLGPLRSASLLVGSSSDRAKRQYTINMSKRALIDLCQQEASKMLVSGQYSLAIPGAIQSLKFLKEIFGEGSVESVPPYLLLAEANLGLEKYQQCEEFLSSANWAILNNPGCSNSIKSQLSRNFGKLYSAQGKLDKALEELSKDIYFSSLEVGPEHVDTSGGYFHMGNIFFTQHKIENALAFYDKVVDIWYKFLALVRSEAGVAETFSEAQLKDGIDMLQKIMSTRTKLLGELHIATGEVKYTCGLLLLFMGERSRAAQLIFDASTIYKEKLGENHPSSVDVSSVAKQIQEQGFDTNGPTTGGGGFSRGGVRTGGSTGGMNSAGGNHNHSPAGITSGSVEGMQGYSELMSQFPSDMPRAATQSPIPMPPKSRQQSAGVDDSMRMSAGGSRN